MHIAPGQLKELIACARNLQVLEDSAFVGRLLTCKSAGRTCHMHPGGGSAWPRGERSPRHDTIPGPSQQVEKGAVAGLARADLRLPAPAFSHLLMIGPSQGPVEATMLRLQ